MQPRLLLSLCFLWLLENQSAECVLLAVWGELTMTGAHISLSDTGCAGGQVSVITLVTLLCHQGPGLCVGWSPQGHCRTVTQGAAVSEPCSSIWLLVCEWEQGLLLLFPSSWLLRVMVEQHRGCDTTLGPGLLSPGRHLDGGGTQTQSACPVGLPGEGHTPSTHLNEHMGPGQITAGHG